jgi:hypothetical protein
VVVLFGTPGSWLGMRWESRWAGERGRAWAPQTGGHSHPAHAWTLQSPPSPPRPPGATEHSAPRSSGGGGCRTSSAARRPRRCPSSCSRSCAGWGSRTGRRAARVRGGEWSTARRASSAQHRSTHKLHCARRSTRGRKQRERFEQRQNGPGAR